MTDPPDIKTNNPTTRTTLAILAQWLDERHDAHTKLAEEFRDGEYDGDRHDSAEQSAIAKTFTNAADVAWELAGGRPGEAPREHERFIKVSTNDLARMLGMTAGIPAKDARISGLKSLLDSELSRQPTTKAGAFYDTLVERLANAFCPAFRDSVGESSVNDGIRAVLAELAKMSCELPFDASGHGAMLDAIIAAATVRKPNDAANEYTLHGMAKDAMYALQMVHACVAPVLAAKDAEIARLQNVTPANECSNAERSQYETTVHLQKERIIELEKRLDGVTPEFFASEAGRADLNRREALIEVNRMLDAAGIPYSQLTVERVRQLIESRDTTIIEPQSAIAIGERLWPRINARRCKIVRKLVTMGAIGPEQNVELHALEEVRRARAALFDALMQIKASRMPDVDEAFQAFANTDEFMNGILGHDLDDETFVLAQAREDQLLAKARAGVIDDAERRRLAQLHTLLMRPGPWMAEEPTSAPKTGRIFLGVTFERELPDGTRERVDPRDIRFGVGADATSLIPIVDGSAK